MSDIVFISSVQKELADERKAMAEFIAYDPLLRRFFVPFLFEDLPASDQRPDDVYLAGLRRNDEQFRWVDGLHASPSLTVKQEIPQK